MQKTCKIKGSLTLPVEAGHEQLVEDLADLWGADALRDSDGTSLPESLARKDYSVYSTICLVRADQDWPKKHPETLPQKFLMSEPVTALGSDLEIDPLAGYFTQKYRIDDMHDPHEWWQVFDRTTGCEIPPEHWSYDAASNKVILKNIKKYHSYTVNFLIYQIWDSTSMYNHLVNKWDIDPIVSTDPYHEDARRHLMKYFDDWLDKHSHTDVVRLTTLAYHFVLDSDQSGRDKYRDWMGYMDTVSIEALQDFERRYGYRMTSEDFVNKGFYNATHCVPSRKYLDWMEFIHDFVIEFGRELVEKIHARGKKAAIFQGDHWIGVEPYSEKYQQMGIDINVGACEDGVALRRLADSPWEEVKEIRLYPYFFPDTFYPGANPTEESLSNWVKIRRAMLRKPIDRIGYGGYLSLTEQFPDFVSHIQSICDEFREIKSKTNGTPAYSAPITVAILNAWGGLRSWINSFGRDQKFYDKRPDVIAVAGSNLLESLAGLPMNVKFISFTDVIEQGISNDIDVIINDGEADSSWSGGQYWTDPRVIEAIRTWISDGGGFIGCRDASAIDYQGRYFQLADVLGLDKEIGHSVMTAAQRYNRVEDHFILDDNFSEFNFDADRTYVYPCNASTEILKTGESGLHVHLACNSFAKGRSVYFSSLPYSHANSRLLLRSIFWAAGKERDLCKWFSSNLHTECAAFLTENQIAVVNNSGHEQKTIVFSDSSRKFELLLKPYELRWIDCYSDGGK
ncbi:MAG: 1,3-beta-galactosyl-N-acetylhexosamine phosphorylase [Sedimentisphaerales bacterium]|nr:1,3-beta-galactosyl-N-acetylhexosamine phosphorylase [Sedimentisphaerales bacterium]